MPWIPTTPAPPVKPAQKWAPQVVTPPPTTNNFVWGIPLKNH